MKKLSTLILLLLLTTNICLADETAITKSGKIVILKDDYTWDYGEEEPPLTDVKYAEEAVEVWDTSLIKTERNYSDAVELFIIIKTIQVKE